MSGKKNRKELTATECRQDAGERVKKLKSQWIIFLRTGLVVTAAAIAVIVGTIAWFMANDKVGEPEQRSGHPVVYMIWLPKEPMLLLRRADMTICLIRHPEIRLP